MQDQPPIRPARRRIHVRVTVRTMMALVSTIGIGLAWVINDGRRQARLQREAVRAIEDAGGFVWYDWQWKNGNVVPHAKPPRPGRLASFLRDHSPGTVVSILVPDESRAAGLLVHVGQLRGLEELDFSQSTSPRQRLLSLWGSRGEQALETLRMMVTDAGVAHLAGLTKLRVLNLSGTDVGDAGLSHLSRLTNLRELRLSATSVTSGGLAHLRGLTNLQMIDLSGTSITDAGLVHLSGLKGLRVLDLSNTRITDAGLVYLEGLTGLQTLDLSDTGISKSAAVHLKKLTCLRSLDLLGTEADDFVAQEIRHAVREVKVRFNSIMAR
jgi:Leucine rich repeat/Leucine Rich repeat